MATHTHNTRVFGAAIITVGLSPADAERLTRMVERMPWHVYFGHFEAYISAARRPSLGPELKSADLCVAVVDFDKAPEQAAESAQYLTQLLEGGVTVVALAKSNDPHLLLTAMRGGCTEFLYKPLEEEAVTSMLERFSQNWANSLQRSTPGGSILTFLGAKGGVGTTTLAAHLAMYLVQCHHKRVLLIDGQPELGHACVYLGLDGARYHFHELVRNVNRLDSELLQGFVANHPSGLKVLSSPDICGSAKAMAPDAVARTLGFLRGEYDYVIVDAPMSFDEVNLATIQTSSRVYLVATQEFAAIRDLSRGVDRLLQIDHAASKLQIVINRFTSAYIINAEQIEKAIKLPITHCIAENPAELLRLSNMGETLPVTSKAEFAAQMVKWSESVTGALHQAPAARRDKKLFPIWKKALLNTD